MHGKGTTFHEDTLRVMITHQDVFSFEPMIRVTRLVEEEMHDMHHVIYDQPDGHD